MIEMTVYDNFKSVEIRTGTIVKAEEFPEAREPAYKLWIDFGEELGIKKTSAQITDNYSMAELLNKQVVAVVNFQPRQIGNFMSEVLVLGALESNGVILLQPSSEVKNGLKIA